MADNIIALAFFSAVIIVVYSIGFWLGTRFEKSVEAERLRKLEESKKTDSSQLQITAFLKLI